MAFKNLAALAFVISLSACNTLMEAASPNDTTQGYRKTQNSSGETVYKRERYVAPTYYVPAPTPTPIPYPVYVDVPAVPVQDNNLVVTRAEPIQLGDSSGAVASSPTLPEVDRNWAVGAEVSSDRKRTHLGLDVIRKFDWLEGRVGISLFSADKDVYAGFDLGVRPMVEIADNVSLFAGAGFYGGDTKTCSYNSGLESCEKKFLYAGYVEGGVYLWNVSLFARSYNIEEAGKAIPSDTFLGIGVRTTY